TNAWWRATQAGYVPDEAGAQTGEARNAVWADLDNDGSLDLITVGRSNRLEFFLGSSGGGLRRAAFAPPVPGAAGDVRGGAVSDADGDGFLDVA
ncbi:MAG TPA: VCBS repeat-containing protein, partial [Verrucomicrobiota bacterium]|nr:VCBS repeat-containing protein [Verrucomicrobiota bacterium]